MLGSQDVGVKHAVRFAIDFRREQPFFVTYFAKATKSKKTTKGILHFR